MMRSIPILLITMTLASCQGRKSTPVWNELPEVSSLSDYPKTAFVPTLEHPVGNKKNIVYAPAFLFAWDEVEKELRTPLVATDSNSTDFKLLIHAVSHEHSLAETEYTSNVEVEKRKVTARAFFNVKLPFVNKLQQLDPISFMGKKVKAFGMYTYDEDVLKSCQILYYKDDDHFLMKLHPKNEQHEVLLVKGLPDMPTLADAVKATYALRKTGEEQVRNPPQYWRYEIRHDDILSIPVFRFNIETRYPQLEKQRFPAKGIIYEIVIAYQRTGFILDENGAVAESEAMVTVDSAAAVIGEEEEHPKKMIFDKPFYIIMKRVNASNPYFVMKADNTELMIIP